MTSQLTQYSNPIKRHIIQLTLSIKQKDSNSNYTAHIKSIKLTHLKILSFIPEWQNLLLVANYYKKVWKFVQKTLYLHLCSYGISNACLWDPLMQVTPSYACVVELCGTVNQVENINKSPSMTVNVTLNEVFFFVRFPEVQKVFLNSKDWFNRERETTWCQVFFKLLPIFVGHKLHRDLWINKLNTDRFLLGNLHKCFIK